MNQKGAAKAKAGRRPAPLVTSKLCDVFLSNGTISGDDLIRVAVTRDISQAVPIAGSFVGTPDSYLGMTVDVAVTSETTDNARWHSAPEL